jgi:hypothetical protein
LTDGQVVELLLASHDSVEAYATGVARKWARAERVLLSEAIARFCPAGVFEYAWALREHDADDENPAAA